MTRALVCALAGLACATPAWADKAYDRCMDRATINPQMSWCGELYLRRLGAALNVAWKNANASLDQNSRASDTPLQESRKNLLLEQRAWLKFREASCDFWANGSFGRDGQIIHWAKCRATITQERIAYLRGISEFVREHQ